MPIVEVSADVVPNRQQGQADVDPLRSNGRPKVITGTVANAADDALGSIYHLATLPAACLLHPDTAFDPTLSGLADLRVGTRTDPNALVAAPSIDGIHKPVAFGDAKYDKPLWQMLGLAENPGGMIELYQHAIANATATGVTKFQITYIFR